MIGYARTLRAIGQALETLNVQDLEMEPSGDDFLVRGSIRGAKRESAEPTVELCKSREIWHVLAVQNTPELDLNAQARPALATQVDLHYTPKDVERFDQQGQARRADARAVANSASLSQTLRTIGGYLSQKRARLLRITRQEESVTVEYETSLGNLMRESLGLSEIYDLCVRMYLQRTDRHGI